MAAVDFRRHRHCLRRSIRAYNDIFFLIRSHHIAARHRHVRRRRLLYNRHCKVGRILSYFYIIKPTSRGQHTVVVYFPQMHFLLDIGFLETAQFIMTLTNRRHIDFFVERGKYVFVGHYNRFESLSIVERLFYHTFVAVYDHISEISGNVCIIAAEIHAVDCFRHCENNAFEVRHIVNTSVFAHNVDV